LNNSGARTSGSNFTETLAANASADTKPKTSLAELAELAELSLIADLAVFAVFAVCAPCAVFA